jgi:D-tyrosyl-tRNA(Tyr) deacylase
MRAVIQRVSHAQVVVDQKEVGAIHQGFMILLGIEPADEAADIMWLVNKIVSLRVFSDTDGLMNLSLADINGEVLVVSQFTLHASYKKGARPSFIKAAKPDQAKALYNDFCDHLSQTLGKKTERGIFGADMKVSLTNDGPVTIVIDTKNKE